MSGGRSDLSEQETPRAEASGTAELNEALDRLKTTIREVAEWAERATVPAAIDLRDSSPQAEPRPGPQHSGSSLQASIATLVGEGAIAAGVFVSGGQTVELVPADGAAAVPASGMIALLDLVPSDTLLEVRTTVSEWRAARVGQESFAIELRSGYADYVDRILATVVPSGND
jgi:hypothetical protein